MPRRRKIATVVESPINSDSDSEQVEKTMATPKKAVVAKRGAAAKKTKEVAAVGAATAKSKANASVSSVPKQTNNAPFLSTINEQSAVQRVPIFELFEKAQTNESLHGKYFRELLAMYTSVNKTIASSP